MKATYLADKSALARMPHPTVGQRLRSLIQDGLVATCAIVDLEILYSAKSPTDYEASLEERRSFDDVKITPKVASRAIEVQQELARTSRHRIPIPDLLIAAAAESAGLTVLHYDAGYERIAAITGQLHEWVAPRGSL